MTAIGVLGPLLLSGPVGPIRLGSARQRRLLAALVAHLGAAVRTELLAELVWDADGGGAPADPTGAVQTNVARLRRLATALALWRGRPYAELDHPSLQPESPG